jgi:hypothetical protein
MGFNRHNGTELHGARAWESGSASSRRTVAIPPRESASTRGLGEAPLFPFTPELTDVIRKQRHSRLNGVVKRHLHSCTGSCNCLRPHRDCARPRLPLQQKLRATSCTAGSFSTGSNDNLQRPLERQATAHRQGPEPGRVTLGDAVTLCHQR